MVSSGNDPPVGTIVSFDTKYLHKDHLGSVDVVTNETGAELERTSFDAWGSRRTTNWQGQQPSSYQSTVSRGYTDHEQLDDLGLVHMNGRIYAPGLGRFLSADPFVQAPMETQNFNRYSYVLNNPLSFTDPSGFNFLNNFGNWLNETLGSTGAQVVMAVAGVAVGALTAGVGLAAASAVGIGVFAATATGAITLTTTGLVVAGAGFGFGSAFISTSLSGASIGQAFTAAAISGAAGAIGACVGANILHNLPFAAKAIGHGLLGGGLSAGQNATQGASPRDGFLAGFVSALFSPLINRIAPETGIAGVALRVGASSVVGGTAAELGGGKFSNGAITAAFLRLFNEEYDPGAKKKFEIRWSKDATELLQENSAYVDQRAAREGVDPNLIRAIILRESSDGIYFSKTFGDVVGWAWSGTEGSFGYAQLGLKARLAAGLTIQEAETMRGSIRGAAKWLAISTRELQAVGISNPSIAQIASQYNSVRQLGQVSQYGRSVAWAHGYVRNNW